MQSFKKFRNLRIRHTKTATAILITLLVLSLFIYGYLYFIHVMKNVFVEQSIHIAEENQTSIFRVSKVILYSGADAIDNSTNRSLQDLDICQYTDIAIHVDNMNYIHELTSKNTIQELWIDNIQIKTDSDRGFQYLNYKNLYHFAQFDVLSTPKDNKIDFNIVNNNEENENADYSSPTFYSDCSNPISLGYFNNGVVRNYSITEETNSLSFNGKILEQAGVPLGDLHYVLTFDIHIRNYENDKFVYHASFDTNLVNENDSLYNGYLYQVKSSNSGSEYNFFKEVE